MVIYLQKEKMVSKCVENLQIESTSVINDREESIERMIYKR
jgi:hypothetical protein